MSEQENQEQKPQPKRYNKYLKAVTAIQEAAINTEITNGVIKELDYQQALSVLLRSQQLEREGRTHLNKISPNEMARQINKCYEQRNNRR